MNVLKLVITEDGSHSIYNPELKEHYHSTHGALQESRHVFIQAGLLEVCKKKKEIQILEIGFGTGLNCLLTCVEGIKEGLTIGYTSLEPYPLSDALIRSLNYPDTLGHADLFRLMHSTSHGNIPITDRFLLHRITENLLSFLPPIKYDLIYFDAFAPDVQPELWSEAVFQKMFDCLVPGGVLVTYCAKGQVKRNMKKAGFLIERLPGPPGKREMTRASSSAMDA
jgi:tRNA U34 5-methylaminomethyl-2-thiouridine-forming methyltransferase MnmC